MAEHLLERVPITIYDQEQLAASDAYTVDVSHVTCAGRTVCVLDRLVRSRAAGRQSSRRWKPLSRSRKLVSKWRPPACARRAR